MGLIRYAEGDIVNDTQRLGTSTWNTKEQLKLQTQFTAKDQCQLYNKKLQQIVTFKKLADQMVSTCH